MTKLPLVVLLLVIGTIAYQETLYAGQTISIRLLSSGKLSYRVQSLIKGDYLCTMVATQFCYNTKDDCSYYTELSTRRSDDGRCTTNDRIILPTTNYTTKEEYLFLFISNLNSLSSSTVVYSYNNTPTSVMTPTSPSPTA